MSPFQSVLFQDFLEARPALLEEPEEEMFRAGEFVPECGGLRLGALEGLAEIGSQESLPGALDLDAAGELTFQRRGQPGGGHSQFLEEGLNESLRLPQQGEQQMFSVNFLVRITLSNGLGRLQSLLRFNREAIELHNKKWLASVFVKKAPTDKLTL